MNSDLLIVTLALAIGCPLFLYLRNRLWTLQRDLQHALPEAIERLALGPRVVHTLVANLCRGVPAAAPGSGLEPDGDRYPAPLLLQRLRRAEWRTRLAVWRDGRPGGWLAGDLLRHLRGPLRANLRLAEEPVAPERLEEELLAYVQFPLLPMLREGQRSAYYGWVRKQRRRRAPGGAGGPKGRG